MTGSESTRVGRSQNADWGLELERHVRDRWPVEDVSQDGGAHHGADVRMGERLGEVKACAYRIADGDSTRYGRWWIPREPLDRLDFYVLGVYDQDGIVEDAVALVGTAVVEALLLDLSWTTVGDSRPEFDAAARLPWPTVFDPRQIEDATGEVPGS